MVNQLGLIHVLNTRGMTYRKLGLGQKKQTSEELFGELFREQGLIKSPLIEKNGKFWVGYDESGIIDFINQ